jgi:sulfide:quinone oxidoreductase
MSPSPLRVVVAGGGVAGLETLMALRALAGEHVELALVAPDDEFVYRPLTVAEPFTVGRVRRVPLEKAARDAGAAFFPATVETVDSDAKALRTGDGKRLEYDALMLAVGAEVMPAVDHVLTWDDRSDAEMLGGLLRDVEQGYSTSLAVLIPPGPGWPLRGYELALFLTGQAASMGIDLRTTIVTPEPAPLAQMGPRALASVYEELARARIAIASAAHVAIERGNTATVTLQPSGQRLEVDRVLALPVLRGRRIAGVRTDADGFIEIDDHCRVRDMPAIWAAGDCTTFPVKSGGFAAEQADVGAEDIAATAGVAIEPRPFDPMRREELAGLPAGRFLTAWLTAGEDEGLTTHLPSDGVPVLTYLQRDLAAGWRGYG